MSSEVNEIIRGHDFSDQTANTNHHTPTDQNLLHKSPYPSHKSIPINNSNPFTLDLLLEKIGFGTYHLKQFITAGLVALMDGAVIMSFSLTVVMLKKQWGYSEQVQSFVASMVFMAVVAGAYVSGPIADKFGRRLPMMFSLFFLIFLNVASAFSPNIVIYTITRSLLAFACGFYSPIGFTYVLEIVPPSMRGKIITMGNAMLFLGQLFVCFVGLFTLETLDEGNWRALTLWATTPAVFAMIMSLLYLDESPRFLLTRKNFDEAVRLIEKSAEEAWKSEITELNEEQKDGLREWMESQELTDTSKEDEPKIKILFARRYRIITIILWFSWFVHSFIYYGLTLFFPYMLNEITNMEVAANSNAINSSEISLQENNLGSLTLSVALESLSVIISFFVIDRKVFGRKRAMIIFYGAICFLCIIAYFDRSRVNCILWTTIIKIVLNVCSFYNYLVTLEVYPTQYRATGVGAATAVGKAGTVVMPWICASLLQLSAYGPFLGFAVMSALACISIFSLPYDTSNKEMK